MQQHPLVPQVKLAPEDRARLSAVLNVAVSDTANRPPTTPGIARRTLLPRKRLLAAGVVAAGIAAIFAFTGRGGDAAMADATPAPASVAVKPAWIDIAQPLQLYSLPAPELDRKSMAYNARRHTIGEGRQDALTFGDWSARAPYVRLNVYRIGKEDAPMAAFFVELARRAAEDGAAIVRSGQPAALPTRFGDFETADATLAGPQGERACLGYRLASAALPLRISGFACGTDTAALDRGALGCILDRLDLVSAGEDTQLRRFFVEAEQRRGSGCGAPRNAAGAKAAWLAPAAPLPALRGSQTTAAAGVKKPGKPGA